MKLTLNWGTGIAAVYTVFAAATSGFVAFAMQRPVELVSDDYYARSLAQDGQMQALRNAAALTRAPELQQHDGSVWLQLPPEHAAAAGTITLYRASDARADRHEPLRLDETGRQRLRTDALLPGHWLVQVRWTSSGREFYVERPVVLP